MPDWIVDAATVLAAFAAVGAVVQAVRRWGSRWLQARRRSAEERRTSLQTDRHEQLVAAVLRRAEQTNTQVPQAVVGRNPAMATWHPDGNTTWFYDSVEAYRRGVAGGSSPPGSSYSPAHGKRAPRPVSGWTVTELEAWLQHHPWPD
jgi:hypothetical protein